MSQINIVIILVILASLVFIGIRRSEPQNPGHVIREGVEATKDVVQDAADDVKRAVR